jgi:hypothetical protein
MVFEKPFQGANLKKLSLLTLPALLLLAGCQLDSISPDRGGGTVPVEPKKTEWEALPTGKSFLQDGEDSNGVPIYLPVKFQDSSALVHGDIAIATGAGQLAELHAKLVDPEEDQPAALAKSSGVIKNSTITGGANAWPGGYIPYFVGGGVDRKLVEEAVYEFNQAGGISYIPWQSKHTSYVVFMPTGGTTSYSSVGMIGNGPQGIYIVPGHGRSVMIHEMGHAAGMYHEQMRSDRDNFVTVTTSGVDDGGWYAANWAKVLDGTNIGAYDPLSIMHYGAGTSTYTRTNGLLYKVTMTSKTGAVLGGSTPTATDKLSLWNVAANGFPFHVQAVKVQLTGKVTKLYTTYANGVTRKFIVIYDPATGNANVNAVNDDNTYGNSVQNYNVGTGFNLISPYQSATGQHLLFYSSTTGAVKLYKLIPAGGAIDPGGLIANTSWNSGWSSIDHYEAGFNKHYWFFQNRATGVNHIWAVANNGGLGANTMTATWPGWNYAKPFYSETSPYTQSAFIVFRMTDGFTRIRRLNSDGTLGVVVQDVQLPSYSAVGVYQSVTKAYLALAGVNALFLVDMDHTGFSTRGTPLFRVAGLPSTITRMDAASDRYSMNGSNSTINSRVYDMKHVVTFEYQSNPGAVFSAWGAPFH